MELSPEFWATSEHFIGTKEIDAIPMTRIEYNNVRGWAMPSNEEGTDPGYILRYADGYISWSPEKQFDEAYKYNMLMGFDHAIYLLKKGYKLTRNGWNGVDQFIFVVPGSTFMVNRPPLLGIYPEGTEVTYLPHIDIKNAQGTVVPWLASQGDMLAEDWCICTRFNHD